MNLNDKQITRLRMIGYPIVTEKNQRVSDAIQWFRDEKGLHGCIPINASGYFWQIDKVDGTFVTWSDYSGVNEGGCWDIYPEAESALLDALLKYLEVKQ